MEPIKVSAPLDKPPSWVVAGLAAVVVGAFVFFSARHWEHESAWFSLIPAVADQMEQTLAFCAAIGSALVTGSLAFQYFERDVPERALEMPTRDEFMLKLEKIEKAERARR